MRINERKNDTMSALKADLGGPTTKATTAKTVVPPRILAERKKDTFLQAQPQASFQPQASLQSAAQLRASGQPAPFQADLDAKSGMGWDGNVGGWQQYCERYRGFAERELGRKRGENFPDPRVTEAVRAGGSKVFVGHWSTIPNHENIPVFFQDFNNKAGFPVQLYSYPRVAITPPSDADIRNAQWVSFDVSGTIAKAYSDTNYMKGNVGTGSALGLPESGAEVLNPQRDWPDRWLSQNPDVAAAMQRGAVKFQIFENGILVDLNNGQVQAFHKAPVDPMGGRYSGGTIDGSGPTPPRSGFVGIKNGHFNLNGKPFKHNGANLAQLLYQPSIHDIWNELRLQAENGVKEIRVFLPNSAASKEEIGDRLGFVLDKARDLGMKVTVSLSHFCQQDFWIGEEQARGAKLAVPGDDRFFTQHVDGLPNFYNHEWFKGGFRENFKPLVEYITSRFKDHEGLFAWEVSNENKDVGAPDNGAAMKAMYREMVNTIKSKDPNHLVSAGLTNTREYWCSNDQQKRDFLSMFDFVSIHQYDNQFMDDIKKDISIAKALGKPVVIGEVGFNNGGGNAPAYSDYTWKAYNEWGVDSVMAWGASALQGSPNENWVFNGGIDNYFRLMRDTNGSLENWNNTH